MHALKFRMIVIRGTIIIKDTGTKVIAINRTMIDFTREDGVLGFQIA